MEKIALKETALRALSILGLIAVLLLGAWGIIQIAFGLSDFFNAVGSSAPKGEELSVTLPSSITAGTAFPISWKHQNESGAYSYAVSYSCATGLSLQVPLPTGAMQEVKCGTPFNYTNATNSMSITARITGKTPVSTTFTVSATKLSSGAVTAHGSATATVAPAAATGGTSYSSGSTAQKPASSYIASGHQASISGLPDLSVTILSATPQGGGRYSVQFVVQNTGTNVAPAGWNFTANIPATTAYSYPSGPQQALYPGDKIIYTLGFNAPLGNQSYYPQPSYYPYSQPSYSGYNPYATCGYQTNYIYNGVYNYPVPSYGCSQNMQYSSGYGSAYSFPASYSNYGNSYSGYSYPSQGYGYAQQFSVTVNALTAEQSTANNYASISIQ